MEKLSMSQIGLKKHRDELLRNSCDGCCAKHPLQNGMHIDEKGKAYMMCQAHKYNIVKGGN